MPPRFFNTTGLCFPERHYMVPPLTRLKGVEKLIDLGQYFVIHAPRQSGKTTYAYALMHKLNQEGRYTVLMSSIQAAAMGKDPQDSMKIAAQCIEQSADYYLPETERPPLVSSYPTFPENGLLRYIRDWAQQCPKPIVLFLDEVDSLLDDNFLTLLYQLRSGFMERQNHAFPHSLALIGLRDVRDYKIRVRPNNESLGTGSPFNIKAKSFFIESFNFEEVKALLNQHSEATGQTFEADAIAEIYRLTNGQPWLVNALAYEVVSEILDDDYSQTITIDLVNQAKEELILRRDTHLDSLVDKLREERIKQVVTAVINGDAPDFDQYNDAILYTRDLGIIASKPPVRFANPIYQEIIPRVLSFGFQESFPQDIVDPVWYIQNNQLDMDALLKAFQMFYREHSEAWLERYDFREVGRQLLLMAFLQRIINGGGRIEREMAIGNGRSDLVISFGDQRFVLELKLNRRTNDEADGKRQLVRYLQRLQPSAEGYLLLFEVNAEINWDQRLRWETWMDEERTMTLVGL